MKQRTRKRQHKDEKGSALLVSLMVMVALSLLGLGFVAVSETESAISVNQRNYTQTQAVAETGARMAVEWFQNAEWANRRGLLPPNDTALKTQRQVIVNGSLYVGYYKQPTTALLCDLPFKPQPDNRFYGDENSADILIRDADGGVAKAFLDRFNSIVFAGNDAGGRITEIRVYAPPIVGGTLVEKPSGSGKKFWEGGTRYGVATVRATATKTVNGQFVAERTVKIVIGDFPFPGPEGPLQSNTSISTNGSFRVHWGKVTSQGDLGLKRAMTSIPWRNAWKMSHFEQGYQVPADCDPTYGCENKTDPTLPVGTNDDVKYNWLYELISGKVDSTGNAFTRKYDDPWFQARSRMNITSNSNNNNQPFPYANITDDPTNTGIAGYSNQFENQDTNDESNNKKEVIFPKIDYVFWKQIAQSGMAAGTDGIYYFTWDTAQKGQYFKLRGTSKLFEVWANSIGGGKAGLLFFDSTNGSNPQNSDGTTNTTVLTDAFTIQGLGNTAFHMRGFIYLNVLKWGTAGLKGRDYQAYAAPSEPYRDVGYRQVNLADAAATATAPAQVKKKFSTVWKDPLDTTQGVDTITAGAVSGFWDCEDLPWSNKASPEKVNNKCDIFVKEYVVKRDSDNVNIRVWLPVPYKEGCDPGNNVDCPTCNCSEPHEPYLNVLYPDNPPAGASGDPTQMAVGWEDPTAQSRKPKVFTDPELRTTPVTCSNNVASFTPESDCTSNAYDKSGALYSLPQNGPALDGVLYNEGAYDSQGNAVYYGSVLVKGAVDGNGNPDVWYDESLSRGDWQKRFPELPRVLITAIETDR